MDDSPINGTASDVAGSASATSNKNTVRESRIVTPRISIKCTNYHTDLRTFPLYFSRYNLSP